MKLFVVLAFFLTCTINCTAQKELYDLLQYTPPKGWKKETGNSQVVYSHVNSSKNTWCQLILFKSTNSKGNITTDFDSEWEVLVAKSNTITAGPQKEIAKEEKGWKIISGGAKASFNGTDMMVLMKTWSDEQVCVSMVARTNDAGYLQHIEDFDSGIELNQAPAKTNAESENNKEFSIVGSWGKGGGVNPKYADASSYGVSGYTKDQYHFNSDGTYRFYSKTYGNAIAQLILIRENGKYTINGNSITITPSQSILESYTKKNGVDEWGKLVSTHKRTLEKVTYRFTKHYFSGIQQWNLVLMADKPTDRDGPFSNNKSFENAWYFAAFSSNNPEIVLPESTKATDAALKETKSNAAVAIVKPVAATSGRFQFTSTNWEDGWVTYEKDNWAEIQKGSIKVLVHYPHAKADAYNSVLKDGLINAWNILVAPRYTKIHNLEFKPVQSFESISFAAADVTDKATGQPLHVVLFKKHYSNGNGRYIEIHSASRNEYEATFGAWHNDEFNWDQPANMQFRNKFAVALADLTGTWDASDYASLSYYYINTGGYAGATATSISHSFTFMKDGKYQSDQAGASGVVGSQKFSRQVYTGNASVNNWKMTLTNRFQGQAEEFDCYFEAVKGGRILVMTDQQNTVYTLARKKSK